MAGTGVKLAIAMMVTAALALTAAEAAGVTCGSVQGAMAPCLTYLRTAGAKPTPACCSGVRSLVTSATTTVDRRTACNCLKTSAGKIPGILPANAANLPAACNAKIPYKISISTNCNNIK